MDAKVTLSFDAQVIEKAKKYAQKKGVSLSRLIELLLRKMMAGNYSNIEDMPVSEWVSAVSEGEAEYIVRPRKRKTLKEEFFITKK